MAKNILENFKKHAVINAKKLTDKQVADIRAHGLIIKYRPDNLMLHEAKQAMHRQQACLSAEAGMA